MEWRRGTKFVPWRSPTVIAQREEEQLKKNGQVKKGESSILIVSLIDKVFKGRETDNHCQLFQ